MGAKGQHARPDPGTRTYPWLKERGTMPTGMLRFTLQLGNIPTVTKKRVKPCNWLFPRPESSRTYCCLVRKGPLLPKTPPSYTYFQENSRVRFTDDDSGRGCNPTPHSPNRKLRIREKTGLSKACRAGPLSQAVTASENTEFGDRCSEINPNTTVAKGQYQLL